jgi:hypothetical protein
MTSTETKTFLQSSSLEPKAVESSEEVEKNTPLPEEPVPTRDVRAKSWFSFSSKRPSKNEEHRTPGSSAATTPVLQFATPREGPETSPALTALDQAFEDDFQKHLKKSNKMTRYSMGAVGAGIGGAVGFFASPVVIPGLVIAGLAGGAGGYQWSKRQGKKLLQKHGAGGVNGVNSNAQSQRPTLRRLRYLARWGSWQLVEYSSAPDDWRLAVLDEVVRSFSPWVQALFLARARARGSVPETDAEALEIFQHLAPLYKWLQKKSTSEVIIEACGIVAEVFKAEAVEGEHAELCRVVFPTILETISTMDRLAPTTHAKLAEKEDVTYERDERKRSASEPDVAHPLDILKQQGRQRLRDIVHAIREVLEEPAILEALANPAVFERLLKNAADKDSATMLEDVEEECSGDDEDSNASRPSSPSASSKPQSPVRKRSGRVLLVVPPEGVEEDDEAFHSCGEEGSDSEALKPRIAASPGGRNNGEPRVARFAKRIASLKENGVFDVFDHNEISVRSESYLKDKKKVPSGPPLHDLVCCDLFVIPPSGPIDDVTHRDFYPYHHWANGDDRFLLILNWVVPPFQGLFISAMDLNAPWLKEDTPQARCWQRFLGESPEDQKKSLKAMCFVNQGPWLVTRAVPRKPVLVGKQVKMTTRHEPGKYMHIRFDVAGCGKADQMAVSMVMKSLSRLQLVLCWMIEGKTEEELPETLITCMSANFIDTSKLFSPDLTSSIA